MALINFLEAAVPLTKRFRLKKDGSIEKDAYPLVANVTSHEVSITTPAEFYAAIVDHANQGHCLLKGMLSRPLVMESRRGATSTDQKTEWICLDFDRHECESIDDVLNKLGLGDITYIVQYSASHGTEGTEGTQSAHVFMLLNNSVPAPELKAWLMNLNFTHLRGDIHLSRSKTVLRYPLDITTCQNDKLLYIAPPIFEKGIVDPMPKGRIQLVPKKLAKLPVDRLGSTHINALKTEERKILNNLRKGENLPPRTAKTSWVGTCEVQNKPDVCTVTGLREQGEFVRLNLNGGDSWAYWHHIDNFELIHDFKSDTWYKTKELVPGYYQELIERRQALNATPTEDGDLILAFRDMKSADYYNGLWNPEQNRLELYRAKNETQLDHWMRSHGRHIGDFIPVWDIQYNPREDWVVDAENHRINLFTPTEYMQAKPNEKAKFPTIMGIIRHMLGVETKEDEQLVEHFLNWFACIFQRKHKPLTAWVTHGTEGTGKGYFMNKIAMPLLGAKNSISVTVSNIEDQFNGWLEGKLLVLVDEVDVDDFREKGRVTARLRNYITEPTMPLRRMRQQTIDVPNHVSFIFSSNRPQPVFIPEGDRRYNVGNFQPVKLPPPVDEKVEAELMHFAEFLLANRADIKQANTVLHTEARARIQKLGVTSIHECANAVKNGDFDTLWLSMPDEKLLNDSPIKNAGTDLNQAYIILMRRLAQEALTQPKNTLSRDEMLLIFQYNVGGISDRPNKFTSLLRHHGIETRQGRRNGQKTYLIDVDWKISDDLRSELQQTLTPVKIRKIR